MTERPDDDPATAEVRRLLAEARHTEPMPVDVAARLDQVLADLPVLPRAGQERPVRLDEPSDELAARRRRRTAGWLVAAAAVVAAFVVVPHISLPSGSTSSSTASTSHESLTNAAGAASKAPHGSSSNALPRSHGQQLHFVRGGRVVVRDDTFSEVAQQLRHPSRYAASQDASSAASCAGVPAGTRFVPAEYQHADAALVFRRAAGGSQVVDLYVCGQDQPVRSARLPAP